MTIHLSDEDKASAKALGMTEKAFADAKEQQQGADHERVAITHASNLSLTDEDRAAAKALGMSELDMLNAKAREQASRG
jgi:phage I-like protein